jgi:ribosomal subunit interface protein
MLNIIIKTKNLELTDWLKKVVNNKIGGLKKFIKRFRARQDILFDTFVELEKETVHHKKGDIFMAEVKMILPQRTLVVKSHGEDLMETITEVKKELEREIQKYKFKSVELPRRKYRKIKKYTDI